MPIFRKYHYSNTIKMMIFLSDIKSYVPIKLCKTSGSIHLFKLTGSINKENITVHKNMLWDIMEIDWRPVTITLSGNVINLLGSVIIPFRDKFKIRWIIKSRPLLLHLMLKQGQTWYPLSNIREMMEIENNISYVPIKLRKTSGSIHLFKLTGSINKENITLHKNMLWDIMEIDWRPVTITLSGNVINLLGSVIIPLRDKFKIRWIIKSRPLLLHLMLKQGQTWYPLSNIREMMEIENNMPQSVEMHIEPEANIIFNIIIHKIIMKYILLL